MKCWLDLSLSLVIGIFMFEEIRVSRSMGNIFNYKNEPSFTERNSEWKHWPQCAEQLR